MFASFLAGQTCRTMQIFFRSSWLSLSCGNRVKLNRSAEKLKANTLLLFPAALAITAALARSRQEDS